MHHAGPNRVDAKDMPLVPERVSIAQHRAFANSEPTIFAKIASRKLVDQINQACLLHHQEAELTAAKAPAKPRA